MAHKTQTYEKIFQAGTAEFVEKGSDGTSMRAIAQRAGLDVSTIFKIYATKTLLLEALMNMAAEELIDRYSKIPKALPPAEKILRIWDEWADFCLNYQKIPSLGTLYFLEARRLGFNPESSLFAKTLAPINEQVSQIIEEGKATGYFRKDINSKALMTALFGVAEELIIDLLYEQKGNYEAGYSPEAARETLGMILNGLNSSGPIDTERSHAFELQLMAKRSELYERNYLSDNDWSLTIKTKLCADEAEAIIDEYLKYKNQLFAKLFGPKFQEA